MWVSLTRICKTNFFYKQGIVCRYTNIYRDDAVRWKPYQKQTALRGCFSPSYTNDETEAVSNRRRGTGGREAQNVRNTRSRTGNTLVGIYEPVIPKIALRYTCFPLDIPWFILTYSFINNFRWQQRHISTKLTSREFNVFVSHWIIELHLIW